MQEVNKMSRREDLPDVQNTDVDDEPIEKVGVRNLTMRIGDKEVEFSCYVNLPGTQKGINMSRLPRIINQYSDNNLSLKLLENVLESFLKENDYSTDAYVKARYKHEKRTTSPESNISYSKFYDVTAEIRKVDDDIRGYLTINIPYISTCPCSEELCKASNKNSYPHQQRSVAEITVETRDENSINRIINDVENKITSIPHTIVKREDEQAIAEDCADNLIFVEDSARIIRDILEEHGYRDYVIVVNHYESIHTHDAVAVLRKGRDLK